MSDPHGVRVVDESQVAGIKTVQPVPKDWTAIIPAAGRGERLGFHKPKLLYPVAGRTILEWLLGELEALCSRFAFVLSPSGAPLIAPELERLVPGRWTVALQPEPLGMGDAVLLASEIVTTKYSLVIWGDHVGARSSTIRTCMIVHGMRANAVATCPTVFRERPYIHFHHDGSDRLAAILQAREGDALPEYGESDCGLFLFRTQALFDTLARMRSWPGAWGRRTKEFNLLPILPLLDEEPGNVCRVRIRGAEQSMGINTCEDAAAVTASLVARRSGQSDE